MPTNRTTIDINEADSDDLEEIEGISAARARLIVEYREEHGPFHNWEELQRVAGIASTLLEKMRTQATLGDLTGDVGDDEEELELESDPQVETLTALAQLDLEAAAAYELCAQYVVVEEVREQLLAFRADHQRHVEDLNELIVDLDGEPLSLDTDVQESLLVKLVSAVSAMGIKPAILSMVANERLTNATYENALALPIDEETTTVLDRNFADEQRHLSALEELAARPWDEPEELEEELTREPA